MAGGKRNARAASPQEMAFGDGAAAVTNHCLNVNAACLFRQRGRDESTALEVPESRGPGEPDATVRVAIAGRENARVLLPYDPPVTKLRDEPHG